MSGAIPTCAAVAFRHRLVEETKQNGRGNQPTITTWVRNSMSLCYLRTRYELWESVDPPLFSMKSKVGTQVDDEALVFSNLLYGVYIWSTYTIG